MLCGRWPTYGEHPQGAPVQGMRVSLKRGRRLRTSPLGLRAGGRLFRGLLEKKRPGNLEVANLFTIELHSLLQQISSAERWGLARPQRQPRRPAPPRQRPVARASGAENASEGPRPGSVFYWRALREPTSKLSNSFCQLSIEPCRGRDPVVGLMGNPVGAPAAGPSGARRARRAHLY